MVEELSRETDVVVIGAGPGGYAAAFRAADLGLEVTLVDVREKPGGVCLYEGCIPSKALLFAAELVSEARRAKELGIHPGQIYNWRRQYKRLSEKQFNSINGVDYSVQESEEIRKLKRQVSDLKEENEFLKKATVRMRPRTSPKKTGEVRLYSCPAPRLCDY